MSWQHAASPLWLDCSRFTPSVAPRRHRRQEEVLLSASLQHPRRFAAAGNQVDRTIRTAPPTRPNKPRAHRHSGRGGGARHERPAYSASGCNVAVLQAAPHPCLRAAEVPHAYRVSSGQSSRLWRSPPLEMHPSASASPSASRFGGVARRVAADPHSTVRSGLSSSTGIPAWRTTPPLAPLRSPRNENRHCSLSPSESATQIHGMFTVASENKD